MSIFSVEGVARADQGQRAPGAATAPDRSNQHVALNRRMRVPDVAGQHVAIPLAGLWQLEQQLSLRAARTQRGYAAVRGPKEIARVPECMAQCLVWLAHVLQVSGQAVNEFERRELPFQGQH